jgi:hypothetical protein
LQVTLALPVTIFIGAGSAMTAVAVAVQPLTSETVTVKVPALRLLIETVVPPPGDQE